MTGFNRRQFLGAGLTAAAMLGLSGRLQAASDPKRTLRFGYVGSTTRPAGPSGWALYKGLLQKHLAPLGFDNISTHAFPNGPDLNEALLGGALDIGSYGDTPAMVCYANNLASRLISMDAVGINAWLVTPKNGVSSVAELKDKVVATALGSYMHRYLIGALQAEGILKDTRIVYMLGRDSEVALARGDIAAYAAQNELGPTLVSNGYPLIDQAIDHPSLRGCAVARLQLPVRNCCNEHRNCQRPGSPRGKKRCSRSLPIGRPTMASMRRCLSTLRSRLRLLFRRNSFSWMRSPRSDWSY